MSEENTDDFYVKFKETLETTTEFPSNYTYKFIIPSDNKKMTEVQRVFDGTRPQFQMVESKNGKYTSITVVIFAIDTDSVIHYYKETSKVEGVIML